MALIEYLYVDDRRLDLYIEQFDSLVTYDKVPVWSAKLGLLGPSASTQQERHARPRAKHEKITLLLDQLRKSGQVADERVIDFADEGPNVVFRLEVCRAQRAYVPPNPNLPNIKGLALWFSPAKSIHTGSLTLLEDFPRSDRAEPSVYPGSGLSALTSLMYEVEDELECTIIPREARSKLDMHEFWSADPLKVLEILGCQLGPYRNIRTLYRLRTVFMEDKVFGTFAYPIFISAL